MLLKIKRDRI